MDLDVLIVRDKREAARKCSLTPLRGMPGVQFVSWSARLSLDVGPRVLLDPEGEEIGERDRGRGLCLIDCAWKHLPRLRRSVRGEFVARRLPPLATAYPRKSRVFQDPDRGLASIEALYAAVALLDRPRPELFERYHWAAEFLRRNPGLVQP